MNDYVGIVVTFVLAGGVAGLMVLLGSTLGKKNPTPEKLAPFECGKEPFALPSLVLTGARPVHTLSALQSGHARTGNSTRAKSRGAGEPRRWTGSADQRNTKRRPQTKSQPWFRCYPSTTIPQNQRKQIYVEPGKRSSSIYLDSHESLFVRVYLT